MAKHVFFVFCSKQLRALAQKKQMSRFFISLAETIDTYVEFVLKQ